MIYHCYKNLEAGSLFWYTLQLLKIWQNKLITAEARLSISNTRLPIAALENTENRVSLMVKGTLFTKFLSIIKPVLGGLLESFQGHKLLQHGLSLNSLGYRLEHQDTGIIHSFDSSPGILTVIPMGLSCPNNKPDIKNEQFRNYLCSVFRWWD